MQPLTYAVGEKDGRISRLGSFRDSARFMTEYEIPSYQSVEKR